MESTTKYLSNGQEVTLVEKTETGFLVQGMYEYPTSEDSEENENGYFPGEIIFVDKVFDTPPTEKLAKDVADLKVKKNTLQSEISELRRLKGQEESVLNKVSKIPNFQMVVNYLNGDFKFVLDTKRLEIKDATRVYNSKNICVEIINGKLMLGIMDREYFNSEHHEVLVFNSIEDAEKERKERFIAKMKSHNYDYALNELFTEYNFKDLAADEDVKAIYDAKMVEIKGKKRNERISSAKKAIEDNTKILKDEGEL